MLLYSNIVHSLIENLTGRTQLLNAHHCVSFISNYHNNMEQRQFNQAKLVFFTFHPTNEPRSSHPYFSPAKYALTFSAGNIK